MPAGYWEYAVQASVAILNCWTPTSRHSNMTAHGAFWGRQPDNSKFSIFGCFVWVWVARGKRQDQKWGDTSIPGVNLGFAYHLGMR
eukprot:3743552-Rhodomonas_salina.1